MIDKAAQITEGYFWTLVERCFMLPAERFVYAGSRRQVCRRCDKATWMTVKEYGGWILREIGLVRAAKEFDSMDAWPMLPEQPYAHGRKLMCRTCKCWIPAKSCVETAVCPLDRWPDVKK